MIDERNLHIYSVTGSWPESGDAVGTYFFEYEVRRLTDVRNLSLARGFRIKVKQRICIPNDGANHLGNAEIQSYTYPVMLRAYVELIPGPTAKRYHLLEVAPKTLNASVSTNVTGSDSTNNSTSSTVTSGSSTSTVNTYEYSLGMPTGGNSESKTEFSSAAQGTMDGRSVGTAHSDSMAVKDWSAYVSLDTAYRKPMWIWAQTFPWDVIQYHYTDQNTHAVTLPDSVRDLLFTDRATTADPNAVPLVNPPSAISLFGPDFAMHAEWIYLVDDSAPVDTLSFTHLIAPFTGYHGLIKTATKVVTLTQVAGNQIDVPSPVLDLNLLALDAIIPGNPATGALVGFVGSRFVTRPSNPDGFSIVSAANTLLIRGAKGSPFGDPISNDAPMVANLCGNASAQMTLYFKIVDDDADYSLYLKHWKTDQIGVRLSISVNGAPPIVRIVESMQSGSGSDNVTRVFLRRKSFTADEYFDYLTVGLNTIVITATADDTAGSSHTGLSSPCGYALRAVAIS